MSKQSYLDQLEQTTNQLESFQQETFEPVKKSYTKLLVWLVIIIGISGAFIIWINQPVEVAALTGLTLKQAQNWADNNKVELIIETEYDFDQPQDVVIKQSPLATTSIKQNEAVTIVVSLGVNPQEIISLPAFDSTWTKDEVIQWVLTNKLTNYQFINQKNSDVETNYLISYSIDSDPFKREDRIEFTIATE